ncbi:MAG: TonB-dependent receptor [Pseudomonadota bacterium]
MSKLVANPVWAAMVAIALPVAAFAQTSTGSDDDTIEEVIVTGTALARSSFDTPAATTSFNEDAIQRLAANSQADILRNVPGVSAEGGGGEIAVNLFIPGLVAAGQFSFTPLVYDGFTTFSYFGLNSSSFDVYHRPDLGIERVEFVRGGASNLFGPGSTAGIVNYISKQGSDTPESAVQFEVAEDGRFGAHFATSGPLSPGSNNYYALSGFYRFDEGPIETGLDTEGYQIKGNFRHDFEDGSGSFSIFAQAIDDNVQFFLPLPLNANTQDFAIGNDGGEVRTIQSGELDNFTYPTANGLKRAPFGDGVTTEGGQLGLAYEKDFNSGWTLDLKGKYSSYDHNFNIFIPAGGDNVLTTTEFLQQTNIPGLPLDGFQSAAFTVLSTGETLSPTDLVYRTQVWSRIRPMRDFSAEINLSRAFETGTATHNVTGGLWWSRADADDFNERIFYLSEFVNEPRLLSLTLEGDNANTAAIETGTTYYSVNGFAGSGGHVNNGGAATRYAFYLADQIEAERWSLDVGLRVENFDGDYFSEGANSNAAIDPSLYGLGANPQLTANLLTDTTGNGQFRRANFDGSAVAFALAGVWRLNETINLYGNYSRGFFWPQLRNLPGQISTASQQLPLGEAIALVEDEFEEETVDRLEIGVKLQTERFDGSIGIYRLEQNDNILFQNVEQPDGTFVPTSIPQDTEATGIDLAGNWSVTDDFNVRFNVSFVDQEVTAGPNDGFELQRQPDTVGTVELLYQNEFGFDASLGYNYRGESFGNLSNSVVLDSFDFIRAAVGYSIELEDEKSLHLGLSVFNLGDEVGLTEGNPRAAAGAAGDFQVARPILPERVYFKATYRF